MEILKIVITLILQISLITLAQNVTQSENDHDKITQLSLLTESTSNVTSTMSRLENSTIHEADKNLTSTTTEKLLNETTETSTADMLIPPASVEAQIEKIDVTSKKPSRIQVIAAQ